MKRVLGVVLLVGTALAACGGSTTSSGDGGTGGNGGGGGGSANISGTAGGSSVAVVDAVGIASTDVENGTTVGYAGAVVSNLSGTCAILQRNANPPNTQALSVLVATSGSAVAPGTYALGPGPVNGSSTSVTYVSQNASCQKTIAEQAQSGTITLSAISASVVTGHFDATFPSGDHLTGDFTAPVCPVDIAALANMTPLPCGQ